TRSRPARRRTRRGVHPFGRAGRSEREQARDLRAPALLRRRLARPAPGAEGAAPPPARLETRRGRDAPRPRAAVPRAAPERGGRAGTPGRAPRQGADGPEVAQGLPPL